LRIFGFFYKFLSIYKLADFEFGGTDFSQKIPWKVLNPSNQVHGQVLQRGQNNGEQIWRGGSPAARGKWGESSGAHGGHGGGRSWGREGLRRRIDGEQGRPAEL
jgi:hypothetical protein